MKRLDAMLSRCRHVLQGPRPRPKPRSRRGSRRPDLEGLERRVVLSTAPGNLDATGLTQGFQDVRYATGLSLPTSMRFAPDGRLFVTQKEGQIRIVKDGQVLPTPFLTIPTGDLFGGLTDMVLDPNFATNGYFYVYYSTRNSPVVNRLSRFQVGNADPNVADPKSEVVLLDNISPGSVHDGGAMFFGQDGMLYLAVGDAYQFAVAQRLDNLEGKVLRIDPYTYPNIIPPNNPFVGTPGARGEIWAYGFRNPFTGAEDPLTGQMFVNDVGDDTWEDIKSLARGGRYGWPLDEGPVSDPGIIAPVYMYMHHTARNPTSSAITGGTFYEGSQFPASYRGDYFFGDYGAKFIDVFDPRTGVDTPFATNRGNVVGLAVGPDGNLYYIDVITGTINQISYVGSGDRAPSARASADLTYGPDPLIVHFSASGTVDTDGDPLQYDWSFGDGTPDQSGPDVVHTFTTPGRREVTLTVTDGRGGSDKASLSVFPGDEPPRPVITSPAAGTTYQAGETFTFSGMATDPEDGLLPPTSLSWTVLFHHHDHTHPFLGPTSGISGGTFTIPATGETDPDVYYQVFLTATDSEGLSRTTLLNIKPIETQVTVTSSPAGLPIARDGAPRATPDSFTSVVGLARDLAAPIVQVQGNVAYVFNSWSDGGPPTQTINVPDGNPTFTANYATTGADPSDYFFATQLYNTLVKRDPNPAELSTDVDELRKGVSPRTIAANLWTAPEHRGQEIAAWYVTLMRREPSADETAYWIGRFLNGATDADLIEGITALPQYNDVNVRPTGTIFVHDLYANLFNRTGSPAEVAYWANQIDAGTLSRATVVHLFLTSDEWYRHQLSLEFQTLLNRNFYSFELNEYLGPLMSGQESFDAVAFDLLASLEYRAKATGTFGLAAPWITPIAPDPANGALGAAMVQFTAPVTGVDPTDFRLTRDGQPVDLSAATIAGSGSSYTLDLSHVPGINANGSYVLRLAAAGSNIFDYGARPLGDDGAWAWAVAPAPTPPPPVAPVVAPTVVDAVAPRVTGLAFVPTSGQFQVTFQDDRSGLDQGTLGDPANYVVTGPIQPGRRPTRVTGVLVTPPSDPTRPEAVTVLVNGGRRLRPGTYTLRVASGGVRDAAGNALDGEYTGPFPSGGGVAGGNFAARALYAGGRNVSIRPLNPPPRPSHPAGPRFAARPAAVAPRRARPRA